MFVAIVTAANYRHPAMIALLARADARSKTLCLISVRRPASHLTFRFLQLTLYTDQTKAALSFASSFRSIASYFHAQSVDGIIFVLAGNRRLSALH
jgi:hypothetical protein